MHRKKPIILVFVRYYLPGYKSGGPVRSIANMVDHLGDDFNFRIVTSDRDVMDQTPYSDVCIDDWNQVGKASVYYASSSQRSMGVFAKLINTTLHDVLYFNSFFDPTFTLNPLIVRRLGWLPMRPVIIAPRGEFSPGALALKRWKKAPYLAISHLFDLYQNITWQASNEHEAADIRGAISGIARNIVVAPNLPATVQDVRTNCQPSQREPGSPLRVIFLSRISPKKNLDFALRVLAKVAVRVELHIFGVIEDNSYWTHCQTLIHMLPDNISATYCGTLDHALVHETLSEYDLFFLPTRGENYGHAIFESLAAGVPVLISDLTPWQDLDQEAVGYVRSLSNENAFVKVIERQTGIGAHERAKQAEKACAYVARVITNGGGFKKNRALFLDVIQRFPYQPVTHKNSSA
jgi:glycosyltransferase involved in cell wall biosynthesis